MRQQNSEHYFIYTVWQIRL